MNKILTPISLWKDFESTENVSFEVISEKKADEILYRELYILGRKTETGNVTVYAVEVMPDDGQKEKYPSLLLLSAADTPVDISLASRFARQGYCVLCVDYRGDMQDEELCTEYPEDIAYANVLKAGRTLAHADEGAKKTAWYEWTAAARFALQYLCEREYTQNVGAIGIREGGEIVWKLMTFGNLSCGICINAAGWISGRNGPDHGAGMDEEQRMFVAGIESQSYAPFVKCPVLMIVSATDTYTDIDYAYDTFARINKDYFSTIDYSTGYNGSIDQAQIRNIDMFADKYLKNREIFIPEAVQADIEERNGALYAVAMPSGEGEVVGCSVSYTEADEAGRSVREWKTVGCDKQQDGRYDAPLRFYEKAEVVYLFARAQYSSGFTVSSKIVYKKLEKKYKNSVPHSKLIFDATMSVEDAFYPADKRKYCLYAFPTSSRVNVPYMTEGYGKIWGAACLHGLKTYRISALRYLPTKKSLLHLDLYSDIDCEIEIDIIRRREDGTDETFRDVLCLEGRKKWTSYVAEADCFHGENGMALDSFCNCRALSLSEKNNQLFVVTNILWI